MKHSLFTITLSATLLSAGVLLGPVTVWAQARPAEVARLHDALTDTAKVRHYAKFKAPALAKQPGRSGTANRNGICDLLTNGDFEIQTLGLNISGPSRLNNLGGGSPGSTGATQPMDSECSGWTSPTYGTPDYYASNAINDDVSPTNGLFATFTPYGNTGGCVGLGTFESSYQRVSEYVSTQVAGLSEGRYYGSFRVQLSNGGRRGVNASNTGVASGFGFQVSNGALPFAPPLVAGTSSPDDILAPTGRGVLTYLPLTNSNVGQWQRISSQFYVANGDQTLTIGLFNASLQDRKSYPINGLTSVSTTAPPFVRTYFLVDDVQLFRIPTAGADITCANSPVTIGEGCEIPGATYAWRISGQSTVLATSLNMTVSPSVTTTYTLTVTLPDNGTCSTSATVSACPAVTGGPSGTICPGVEFSYYANSNDVTWTTSPAGFFDPATGSGSVFSTMVSPFASGQGTITATFNNVPGQVSITRTINVGTPPLAQITIDHPTSCPDNSQFFRITNYDPHVTYHMVVTTPGSNALPAYLGAGYANGAVFRIKGGAGVTGAYFTITSTKVCGSATNSVTTDEFDATYPECSFGRAATSEASATAYPNPASESLALPSGITEAVLLNSQGKAVSRPDKSGRIDVRDLPAGLYNLRMKQEGKFINQRIEIKH